MTPTVTGSAVVRTPAEETYGADMKTRFLLGLLLVSACHDGPTRPYSECPRPPGDTTTVLYNGERIYRDACPALP